MIPNPIPSPDLTSFSNRFLNEEFHQIGLAVIQQSQHSIPMQQQVHHPASSQHSPRRLPYIIRPSLKTISSTPPLMNQQPNCSEVRPLMEQQTTLVTSTPRRPASDSFDNSDGNRQRMKNRIKINDLPPHNEQVEQHHLPTLVPTHHHQHSFNMNVLKRAVSSNLPCFFIIFSALFASYNISYWLSTNIREELVLVVDKDLTTGAIKRSAPGEISRPFQQYANAFPLLNRDNVNSHSAWTTSGNESLHSHLKKEMSDLVVTIKALSETMIRTEKSFNDLNNRIEVQHKSTILHCNSIERSKLKKNINKSIENLQKWKKQLDSNKSNQSTASISSPHLITTNNIIDNNNNGEVEMNDDFSMNSLDQDV
ncbi:unnamed protein product [Rotaria magnacalcarata]|uniref:Uncharacterized protein n=1 Tax=Rotaria magnacalcarata TaxID=392030 RepID=A0A816ZQZ9_9BILA|nr:unnamed protein product [Rotaria magnacalcarata]